MCHDDGRKSRCKLCTTMTKRSSHMPTFTDIATKYSQNTLRRHFLNHISCGIVMLQSSSE